MGFGPGSDYTRVAWSVWLAQGFGWGFGFILRPHRLVGSKKLTQETRVFERRRVAADSDEGRRVAAKFDVDVVAPAGGSLAKSLSGDAPEDMMEDFQDDLQKTLDALWGSRRSSFGRMKSSPSRSPRPPAFGRGRS